MCLCTVVTSVRWTFRILWKIWKNCGTYGHSRIITLSIRLFLMIALKLLSLFHWIMDHQPLFPKDPRNLSVEIRAFNSILSVVKSLIPIKQTWPLLNNCLFRWDFIFLQIFNRIVNVGMGALLHIPIETNITKYTLSHSLFTASCYDALPIRYESSSNLDSESTSTASMRSYAEFTPRDVDYYWISGNDQIDRLSIEDGFILYLHGGGYAHGGPSHMGYVSRLSTCSNLKVLFVEYSKPPNADIPFQVDQILTIYLYILLHHGIDPKRVVVCGDSAGGGLCMLMMQKLSSLGLSSFHPSGVILYSPWLDLTMEADSWIECQYHDMIVCKTYVSRSGLIAVGNDRSNLRSPFFSALYAENYEMDCNVMILVSNHECLYDDSARLAQQLRKQQQFYEIPVDHEVDHEEDQDVDSKGMDLIVGKELRKELIYLEYDYLPHAFPLFYGCFPEANDPMQRVCKVIHRWTSTGTAGVTGSEE